MSLKHHTDMTHLFTHQTELSEICRQRNGKLIVELRSILHMKYAKIVQKFTWN